MDWVTRLPVTPKWLDDIQARRTAISRLGEEQAPALAKAGLVNLTHEALYFLNNVCGVCIESLVFATEAVMEECVAWEANDNAAIRHKMVVATYPGHGQITQTAYASSKYVRVLELLTAVHDMLEGESFSVGDEIDFDFYCVPRDGTSVTPALFNLTVSVGERRGGKVFSIRKSDE